MLEFQKTMKKEPVSFDTGSFTVELYFNYNISKRVKNTAVSFSSKAKNLGGVIVCCLPF